MQGKRENSMERECCYPDCFNCPFDDCINDKISREELEKSRDMDHKINGMNQEQIDKMRERHRKYYAKNKERMKEARRR